MKSDPRRGAAGLAPITALGLAAALFLSGCVSAPDITRFSARLDGVWGPEAAAVLRDQGARVYQADPAVLQAAMADSLRALGMTVEEISPGTGPGPGIVSASAIGPVPLSEADWDHAAEVETPRMQRVAAETIGPLSGALAYLDPSSYRIFFSATQQLQEGPSQGVQVTLAARMGYVGSAMDGARWPTVLPPQALRAGAATVWAELDRTLTGRGVVPVWQPVTASAPDSRVPCLRPDGGEVVVASLSYCRSVGGAVR